MLISILFKSMAMGGKLEIFVNLLRLSVVWSFVGRGGTGDDDDVLCGVRADEGGGVVRNLRVCRGADGVGGVV